MEVPNAVTSALSAPTAPTAPLFCWGALGAAVWGTCNAPTDATPRFRDSVAVLHVDDFTRPTPAQRLVAGDLPRYNDITSLAMPLR